MPFLSIRDDSHPHLVFDPNTVSVPRNTGQMHEIGLASQFMRLTARGLHYASYLNTHEWKADALSFNSTDCVRVPDALCAEHSFSSNASMLYFPTGVVDLPDDIQAQFLQPDQTPYVQYIMATNSTCTNAKSGRIIKPHDDRYEISLCDLLDNNLDIVVDNQRGRLLLRVDETGVLTYIVISILGIYLVSCLAENIRHILNQESSPSKPGRFPVFNVMMAATVVFIARDQFLRETTRFMLFEYERVLHFVLALFVYVCAACHAADTYSLRHQHMAKQAVKGVSMLTASICLLSARVHYSFDNPYTWILSLIFSIRSAHKFLNRITSPMSEQETKWEHDETHLTLHSGEVCLLHPYDWSWVAYKHLLHLFDAVVLICLLTYGITPAYNQSQEADVTIFLLLIIALMSGTLIAFHKQ